MNEQDETKAEAAEEKKLNLWLNPSPVGEEYRRHERAMKRCAEVPVYMSFALDAGFNVGMLRKLAEGYKPKRIVVIDHGEAGYEVTRLDNTADIALFYASITPKKSEQASQAMPCLQNEQLVSLKRIVSEFMKAEDSEIVKYDANGVKSRAGGCIGNSYIQRRLVSTAAFKRSEQGATKAIHEALLQFETEGYLRKLSESESLELFGCSATFFRINKAAFE